MRYRFVCMSKRMECFLDLLIALLMIRSQGMMVVKSCKQTLLPPNARASVQVRPAQRGAASHASSAQRAALMKCFHLLLITEQSEARNRQINRLVNAMIL